jgi:hypothetical protein
MLGSISVSSMRKLMVLALAGGLALGGSSLGSGGAMAAGEAGPVLPDGPYAFDGGTAIFGAASRFGATAVGVNLTGGTAQLIGSCLPYGSGTYTAAPDGRWSFTPGTLSEKGCAGHEARQLAAEALAALTQATTWQLLPDPTNPTETAFAVTGPSGTLELQTDSLTIAPTPPDDPAPIPALEGDWRVETIERTNLPPRLAKTGPYAWKVTVWSDTVSFPDGAAAYTRPAYFVATPSGGFHVRQGRHVAIAAVLTPGLHNEYGDLATALSAANR